MNELVSIIIVNWNGISWLDVCFKSLTKQDYKNYEIIFVDNASTDSSVKWVRNHYPKTKIIINKKNLGFSDANNIGYKYAKGKYILFLNNDTRCTPTFLSNLVHDLEKNPKIGGMQSKILLMDTPDTHDSVGAFLTPTGFLYHYGFGKKNLEKYNRNIDLYTAKGACMIFRKAVLDKVAVDGNIFDPDYFAYFEETDMCHRIWLSGFAVTYNFRSVVYHKMGGTSSGMNNAFIQFHSFKNRIHSYIKNFDMKHLITILPVHIIFCQLFAFASLLKGKGSLFMAIQKALVWNIIHIGSTLKKRSYIQNNIRVVTDTAFWKKIFRTPKLVYYWYLFKGSSDYEESV